MRRAVLADTGPLYAANDEGDSYHPRAVEDLKKFAREGCEVLIAYPILLEGYSLVLKRLGKSAAGDWLAEVSNSSFVNPTSEDYSRAFVRIHALADQSITLVDATVAVLADRLGLPVWTYDHHFDVMRVSVWR